MELIDRQALIATLGIKEECGECVHKALIYCKLDAANACDAIMNAPTIEPKHGRWIKKDGDFWECSECGQRIFSMSKQDKEEFYKWCGRCGARMDEVEE